jgi:hypothetical protein
MPEYYNNLLYLWKCDVKMYAVMGKGKRWFLVERIIGKRTPLKALFRMDCKDKKN